jgi:hypothetical protein
MASNDNSLFFSYYAPDNSLFQFAPKADAMARDWLWTGAYKE